MTETATPPVTPTSATPTNPTPDAAAPVVAAPEGSVLGDAGDTPVVTDPAAPLDPANPDPNAPVAATVPEKYEISLGDGVAVDSDIVTAADPILRELNLNNEQANKLAPVAQKIVEATQAGILQQLQDGAAAQKKEWLDAFQADPEIGGANRAQTETRAAKALDAMGYVKGHPFREALTASGFGNHPDMIRMVSRLGEMVGEEGTFLRADVAPPAKKSAADRLYPNG